MASETLFDLISHISDLRLSALCLCASAPLHLTKLSSFVIVFMQNKPNYKTEDRIQKTEDSKIMAKDKPNVFYNCRESSTNQAYFLQNKPNFRKSQMNVNLYITTDYENKSNWTLGENKPNQSQFARG